MVFILPYCASIMYKYIYIYMCVCVIMCEREKTHLNAPSTMLSFIFPQRLCVRSHTNTRYPLQGKPIHDTHVAAQIRMCARVCTRIYICEHLNTKSTYTYIYIYNTYSHTPQHTQEITQLNLSRSLPPSSFSSHSLMQLTRTFSQLPL